jgi:hypothetical protein
LAEDKDGEEEGGPVADVRRASRVSTAAARERPSWCCKRCISAWTAWRKVRVWLRATASVENKEEVLLMVVVQSKGVSASCFPPPPPLLSMICVVRTGVMMMIVRKVRR